MMLPVVFVFLLIHTHVFSNAVNQRHVEKLSHIVDDIEIILDGVQNTLTDEDNVNKGDDVSPLSKASPWDYERIAVRVSADGGEKEAARVLGDMGFELVARHPTLPNVYEAVRIHDRRKRSARDTRDAVPTQVHWFEPLVPLTRVKRTVSVNDPQFFKQEKQFSSLGVLSAWDAGLSGKGVTVGVVDDGINFTVKDLWKSNHSKVYVAKAKSGVEDSFEHGTLCAGVIAMQPNNKLCGVGIAPDVKIVDIPLLLSEVDDFSEAIALYPSEPVDILTCSWGPPDDGWTVQGPQTLGRKAIQKGATMGRNGLGMLYVWASGNGGLHYDDCAMDGFVGSRYTIPVAVASPTHKSHDYSEGCAAIMTTVGAQLESGDVLSTTSDGLCTTTFRGTSAAAPIAAGQLALLLEKRSNLTRRDVTHLIVHASDPQPLIDADSYGWVENGAGHRMNRKFGFGLLNISRAIELSDTWESVDNLKQCTVELSFPGNGSAFGSFSFTPTRPCLRGPFTLEHVELTMSLAHPRRGDIEIEIESPSGTRIQLLSHRPYDNSTDGLTNWTMPTSYFWDEKADGEWKVDIVDFRSPRSPRGSVQFLGLTLHLVPHYRINDEYDVPWRITNAQRFMIVAVFALVSCVVIVLMDNMQQEQKKEAEYERLKNAVSE